MSVSALLSPFQPSSMLHLFRYAEYGVIATVLFIVLRSAWDDSHWVRFSWVMLLSALVSGGSVLSDYFGVTRCYLLYTSERPYVRHMGILGEANYGAGKLCVLLPFLLFLAERYARDRRWGKLSFVTASLLVVLSAVFVSGSRMAGFIASLILSAFLFRQARSSRRLRGALTFALLLAALGVATVLPLQTHLDEAFNYVTGRYGVLLSFLGTGREEYGHIRESAIRERIDVLAAGAKMILERPMRGVGPGGFPAAIGEYDVRYTSVYSHNTYLSVLAELGALGFLLFALLCVQILRSIRRLGRHGPERRNGLPTYLTLAYVSQLLVFLFLHDLDSKYLWTLFLPFALYADALPGVQCRTAKPSCIGRDVRL
jgi:O-antigen ligase